MQRELGDIQRRESGGEVETEVERDSEVGRNLTKSDF